MLKIAQKLLAGVFVFVSMVLWVLIIFHGLSSGIIERKAYTEALTKIT